MSDKPTRVAFDMSPSLANQVKEVIEVTGLKKAPEVFRYSFSIFRTYIDAMREGKQFHIIDPKKPDEKRIMIPPFHIKPMEDTDV